MDMNMILNIARKNESTKLYIERRLKRLLNSFVFEVEKWYYDPASKVFFTHDEFLIDTNNYFHNTTFRMQLDGIFGEVFFDNDSDLRSYRYKIIIKEDEKSSSAKYYLDILKSRREEFYNKFRKDLYVMAKNYFADEKEYYTKCGIINFSLKNEGLVSKTMTVWESSRKSKETINNTKICYANVESLDSYENWYPALFYEDEYEHVLGYEDEHYIKTIISKRNKYDRHSDLIVNFVLIYSKDNVYKLILENARNFEKISFNNDMCNIIKSLKDNEWFIDPDDNKYAISYKYVIAYDTELDRCIEYLSEMLPMDRFKLSKEFVEQPLYDFDKPVECLVIRMLIS